MFVPLRCNSKTIKIYKDMVWLAADEHGEYVFLEKPKRGENEWYAEGLFSFEELAFGEINRLLGRTLTFEDDPVEINI